MALAQRCPAAVLFDHASGDLVALAAALSPLMQQGNLLARKVHVGLNMSLMTLFLWQAVSGMQIVNKIWENRPV